MHHKRKAFLVRNTGYKPEILPMIEASLKTS